MATHNWYQIGAYSATTLRADYAVGVLASMARKGTPTPVSGKSLGILLKNRKQKS